jgi:hypothetical protein
MRNLDSKTEKRWVGTSEAICSVSEEYVDRISALTARPGFTVMNGFNALLNSPEPPQNKAFTLLYSGSLYAAQPLEAFMSVWTQVLTEFPNLPWKMVFLGLSGTSPGANPTGRCLAYADLSAARNPIQQTV